VKLLNAPAADAVRDIELRRLRREVAAWRKLANRVAHKPGSDVAILSADGIGCCVFRSQPHEQTFHLMFLLVADLGAAIARIEREFQE
jgi:hypothetical protein